MAGDGTGDSGRPLESGWCGYISSEAVEWVEVMKGALREDSR